MAAFRARNRPPPAYVPYTRTAPHRVGECGSANPAPRLAGQPQAIRLNSLVLEQGAVVTHSACTATATHKLDLTVAGTITVDASSRINVSGKGYLAGQTVGNTTEEGAKGRASGSYGGQAPPDGEAHPSNAAYGDYREPAEWGSGGGPPVGGTSGGWVRIEAGQFVHRGTVTASGQGAGSGGTINVHVGVLTGTGSFRAGGGSQQYAGGSGGRIAIHADDYDGFSFANTTTYTSWGPAGTVYLYRTGMRWGV